MEKNDGSENGASVPGTEGIQGVPQADEQVTPEGSTSPDTQLPQAEPPYAQPNPYTQATYPQTPYAQPPQAEHPYAQPNPYAQAAYPQTPYAQEPYGQNPYVPPAKQSEGLQIASLVSSISGALLGLAIPLGVVGIILGIIGVKKAKQFNESKGMGVAGIVVGAVSVGITLIIVAIIALFFIGAIASASESNSAVRAVAEQSQEYYFENQTYENFQYQPTENGNSDGEPAIEITTNETGKVICVQGTVNDITLHTIGIEGEPATSQIAGPGRIPAADSYLIFPGTCPDIESADGLTDELEDILPQIT